MSKQAEYSKRNHGSSASSASSASSPSSFTTVRRHPRNPYNKHLQTPSPNPLHPHCIPKSPIVRKSPPPSPSSPSPSFSSISQNEISFDYGEVESAPAPVCPEKQTKELAQAIRIGTMKNETMSEEASKKYSSTDGTKKKYKQRGFALHTRLMKTLKDDINFVFLTQPGKGDTYHPSNPDHKLERFFEELGGERDNDKKVIFNRIFLLVVHTWKQRNGEPYQFNSVASNLTSLCGYYNKAGIPYHMTEFKCVGGFLLVAEDLANEEVSRDETGTYGTKPTKVEIPYDFHERVYRTYKENKTFHPNPELENFDPTDLQTACIYNCANAFAMRGQSEHHNLKWSYITFGIVNYQDG